jgi:hypothetical protein
MINKIKIRKILFIMLCMILLASAVRAEDYEFQNKSGSALMIIHGTGNVSVTGDVNAEYFIGDGSKLTGISIYNTTYDSYALNVSRNWTSDTYDAWGSQWYNHTSSTFDLWNSTWDNNWVNEFTYNHTSTVFTLWNSTWDNSWVDVLAYNHTSSVFGLWNSIWDESSWAIDTFLSIANSAWNKSGTDVPLNYPGDSVGIGTDTPTNKLNVVGTFNTTFAGSSLVADASGNIKVAI